MKRHQFLDITASVQDRNVVVISNDLAMWYAGDKVLSTSAGCGLELNLGDTGWFVMELERL